MNLNIHKDLFMEISSSENIVTIKGNIKTVSNYKTIKSAIDNLTTKKKNITIKIADSFSITSSVIGYFNKLILKDKIDISMTVSNSQLIELLEDLNLVQLFKARKV